MRLWYDDIRRPPDDSWHWARTNADAMALLAEHEYDEVSLDHDMGLHLHDPDEQDADLRVAPDAWAYEDGTDLVRWMVENGIVPPVVRVHSFNPDGARRMARELLDAAEHLEVPCQITIKPFDPSAER